MTPRAARRSWLVVTATCVACAPALLRAQESASSSPTITSPTIEPLMRMGLALVAIGIAAWAVGAWARRRRILKTGTDHRIEILALRSLGPRQRLALVEVGERRFLIGVGGDQIRPIADLSDSIDFERQVAAELERDEEPGQPPMLTGIGRFEGLDG